LDTALLALLAAQRWRQTGSGLALAMSAVWSLLAPCWFASGILAGPLCALYLLPLLRCEREGDTEVKFPFRSRLNQFLLALVPILGTTHFLAYSLPLNGE